LIIVAEKQKEDFKRNEPFISVYELKDKPWLIYCPREYTTTYIYT